MTNTATSPPSSIAPADARAPYTLGIDIGGTNVKASVLDRKGELAAERVRLPTPRPATPQSLLGTIDRLVVQLPPFERISVGFPGVVKGGAVVTAPNLGTPQWAGYPLTEALGKRFGVPVRMLNDAAVHGLGVVEGKGLECVITLGTGIGCALFRDRRLLLHLELGQFVRVDMTYDQYVGQAALEAVGPEAWNERVRAAITAVAGLTCCDLLYIGGGNARKITFELPANVKIVSNSAGVTGGVRLWEPAMEELFAGESRAQSRAGPERTA